MLFKIIRVGGPAGDRFEAYCKKHLGYGHISREATVAVEHWLAMPEKAKKTARKRLG